MESIKKRIFIVGAQRSGTTLLRLILNAHSQIAIPRDCPFLLPFLKKKYLNHFISGSSLKTFCDYISSIDEYQRTYVDGHYNEFFSQFYHREKMSLREMIDGVFSGFCHSEGKSIWGSKTPTFFRKVDIFFTLFPDAKFIHIIRDGRDVFDSLRKMNPLHNNVTLAALNWKYKLFRIEKSFKKIPVNNKITIRYEDLLIKTEETIKSICTVLGIEYEASMLDFHISSYKNTSLRHSKLIFKPIKKDNKEKWKNNLTSQEIRVFNLLAGNYLKRYNYEVANAILNLFDVMRMLKGLLIGLPQQLIILVRRKKILEKGISS